MSDLQLIRRELELEMERLTKELADIRVEKEKQRQRIEKMQLTQDQLNDQLKQTAANGRALRSSLAQQLHKFGQYKRNRIAREPMSAKSCSTKTSRAPLPPTNSCINRIQQDLIHLHRTPVMEGIFVVPDEDKLDVCHAIILGPQGTPYEGGFFYFLLEFPHNYPHNAPKVTLQTTGGGRVQFNPIFFQDGTLRLSMMRELSAPVWSPVQTIESVLVFIRLMMNEHYMYSCQRLKCSSVFGPWCSCYCTTASSKHVRYTCIWLQLENQLHFTPITHFSQFHGNSMPCNSKHSNFSRVFCGRF